MGRDMKVIPGLSAFVVIVGGALVIGGCAHQPRSYDAVTAQCVDHPPPTSDEMRRMPTGMLRDYYQLSRRYSQELANATVVGYAPDPCHAALAMKQLEFEQELKYR
jgi:hypothetical protein